MMQQTARDLIFSEAFGEHGIVSMARFGEDPGAARFAAVVDAIKEFYQLSKGSTAIEKDMALALHSLAFDSTIQYRDWLGRGHKLRDDLYDRDLPRLAKAVDSLLQGMWLDPQE